MKIKRLLPEHIELPHVNEPDIIEGSHYEELISIQEFQEREALQERAMPFLSLEWARLHRKPLDGVRGWGCTLQPMWTA